MQPVEKMSNEMKNQTRLDGPRFVVVVASANGPNHGQHEEAPRARHADRTANVGGAAAGKCNEAQDDLKPNTPHTHTQMRHGNERLAATAGGQETGKTYVKHIGSQIDGEIESCHLLAIHVFHEQSIFNRRYQPGNQRQDIGTSSR